MLPLLVSKILPTSGFPDKVFLGQNSPSVGMGYWLVPPYVEVILVKVPLSGASVYSTSATELVMSFLKIQPTCLQARKSPKLGSLDSSFHFPTMSSMVPIVCNSFSQPSLLGKAISTCDPEQVNCRFSCRSE